MASTSLTKLGHFASENNQKILNDFSQIQNRGQRKVH